MYVSVISIRCSRWSFIVSHISKHTVYMCSIPWMLPLPFEKLRVLFSTLNLGLAYNFGRLSILVASPYATTLLSLFFSIYGSVFIWIAYFWVVKLLCCTVSNRFRFSGYLLFVVGNWCWCWYYCHALSLSLCVRMVSGHLHPLAFSPCLSFTVVVTARLFFFFFFGW